jgi:toxin ParE1/3/4
VKLEWSEAAQADRNAIYDFIDANNPRAAIAVDDRIEEAVERLVQFPMSGRIGRVEGSRELVIDRTPYIAAYRIADRTIRVLRLLHGAQEWPDDF